MRKIMILGAAGMLSLAMGTSVLAADSAGGYACAMIGHHRTHMGYISSLVYAKNYCDNYTMSGDVLKSVETCVTGRLEGRVLADQVCQNGGVCIQGCPGGYVDADGNGICDTCESAGYHGSCDNFADADGDGVCDNLHNGYDCGNVNGSGNGNGNSDVNGNSGAYGSGNGYNSGSGNGRHHSGGHGRGCRR